MKFIPVKDKKYLYRDSDSNAIINTDKSTYHSYMKMREQKLKDKERIDLINDEVKSIKDDLKELKSLIHKLVEDK